MHACVAKQNENKQKTKQIKSPDLEVCYDPIVMSGGKYNLSRSNASDENVLKADTVIMSIGRYTIPATEGATKKRKKKKRIENERGKEGKGRENSGKREKGGKKRRMKKGYKSNARPVSPRPARSDRVLNA